MKATVSAAGRERDAVAQRLGDREQPDAAAVLLGAEMPAQLLYGLSGAQEVVVVDGDVFHAGVGERRDDAALPDPLGEPAALGPAPDQPLQPIRQGVDLADAVAGRDRCQHRLRIAAAEQLRLSAIHHRAQQRHVLRIVIEQPLQQPAAEVRGELEVRIAVQRVQERAVAQRVRLLQHLRKVAGRLVRVHAEQQGYGLGHRLEFLNRRDARDAENNRSERIVETAGCMRERQAWVSSVRRRTAPRARCFTRRNVLWRSVFSAFLCASAPLRSFLA